MPKNAVDNPLVLPILGLLLEGPRHAYAVFSELRGRYEYLDVRNATVYTLLRTLADRGWVAATDGGPRPVLAVTAGGSAELARRVERDLREADPSGGPGFIAALAYLAILGRDRADAVLRDRAGRLADRADRLDATLRDTDVAEIHMIEAHYLASRLRHDVAWLLVLADRIRSGELGWPLPAGPGIGAG